MLKNVLCQWTAKTICLYLRGVNSGFIGVHVTAKNAIHEFYECKQKTKPSYLWLIVLFCILPAAKELTKCFKKMQGKLITMNYQLEHLNALLRFLQLSLESAPGDLDKEKPISSKLGSLIEANFLWDNLLITENDN
jgi:hypothetical protein